MDKYKKVKNILLFILVANLVVAFLKLIVGGYINSSSVLADGFHSLSDSASNIVGIVGILTWVIIPSIHSYIFYYKRLKGLN